MTSKTTNETLWRLRGTPAVLIGVSLVLGMVPLFTGALIVGVSPATDTAELLSSVAAIAAGIVTGRRTRHGGALAFLWAMVTVALWVLLSPMLVFTGGHWAIIVAGALTDTGFWVLFSGWVTGGIVRIVDNKRQKTSVPYP